MKTHYFGKPTVLVVACTLEDRIYLGKVLNGLDYAVTITSTCERAIRHLSRHATAVVVSDDALPNGDWKDLLAYHRSSDPRPRLIVAASAASCRLWAEVLSLGGYDVLTKPFRAEEIAWVVLLAATPALESTLGGRWVCGDAETCLDEGGRDTPHAGGHGGDSARASRKPCSLHARTCSG